MTSHLRPSPVTSHLRPRTSDSHVSPPMPSENRAEQCAHIITHSDNYQRYDSIMITLHTHKRNTTQLTKCNAFVYLTNSSCNNVNLSQITSLLSPVMSMPHLSPLASHLLPLTRSSLTLSPLTRTLIFAEATKQLRHKGKSHAKAPSAKMAQSNEC